MNYKIYRFLSKYLGFLIDLYVLYRKNLGKEDPARINERLGKPTTPRPKGALAWVHAASIGEAVSVLPLLEKLSKQYPSLNILFTTGTVTSANILKNKLPKKAIHQFVPVDKLTATQGFLSHWRPDVAMWVESELWPNLVYETATNNCPLILINARMSSDSSDKWQKYPKFAHEILSCFSLCIVQAEEYANRFKINGAKMVVNGGNLKYEAPPLPADPSETGKLINQIAGRPTWLAASTNKGEEEIIAYTQKIISQQHKNLLTIIVPRHPKRADEIREMLSGQNLTVKSRSLNEEITADTQIYLADTVGEMGIFYRICGVVFMGGSMVPHGGQNPLEPARLECAIISGIDTHNFREVYSDLEKHKACIIVKDATELATRVSDLLTNNQKREQYSDAAFDFVESKSGIIDGYLKLLEPYLKPLV